MARDEQRWHLFLDESGDFRDGSERVACVVGWMLRDDAPRELDRNLREMLGRAAPLARYPLHTSHANQPSWWLASWLLASDTQRRSFAALHPREAAMLPVWATDVRARLAHDLTWRLFFDAVAERSMPTYEVLQAASRSLWARLPEAARVFDGLTDHLAQRMVAMLDLVAEAYTDEGLHLIAAAWFPRHDPDGALEGSHYLHALSALFERVAGVLRGRDSDRHRVDVHAARLALDHPTLSQGRRAFLSRATDIGHAARVAAASPLAPPSTSPDQAQVRFVADVPAAYGPSVHPGIVFADFLSNTLWRAMRGASGGDSWAALSACITARRRVRGTNPDEPASLRFEAPLRAAPPPRPLAPMIAVSGRPAEFVRSVWRGDEPPTAHFDAPAPWAREQAERWARLAEAVRP